MATRSPAKLLDIITTIFLFIIGIAGLYKSLEFPDRSGMWPTFVMMALIITVAVHLFNLFRGLRRPHQEDLTENGPQGG